MVYDKFSCLIVVTKSKLNHWIGYGSVFVFIPRMGKSKKKIHERNGLISIFLFFFDCNSFDDVDSRSIFRSNQIFLFSIDNFIKFSSIHTFRQFSWINKQHDSFSDTNPKRYAFWVMSSTHVLVGMLLFLWYIENVINTKDNSSQFFPIFF